MKKVIILTIFFVQFSFAKAMDTSCSQDLDYDDLVIIIPSSINANITDRDFPNEKGKIGVTAKISGNGNTREFSSNFSYTKVGNRLELWANKTYSIPTNANLSDFKSFFGPFPQISCIAR